MIPVKFHRGLHLPEADLWLDPWDAKPLAFVSHAHADHFARHQTAICSATTAALVRARYKLAEKRLLPLAWHSTHELNGHRVQLLPAGHIFGSAMIHVTRLDDGATLLYTGDFKVRRGRAAEEMAFRQADLLVLETTFALPKFTFPSPLEIEAEVLRFIDNAFHDDEVPVLLGYSLGKAQEALALIHEHGIPAVLHPKVAEMTEACRAAGLDTVPEPALLEGTVPPGTAVIAPPNAVRSKLLRSIRNRRIAMLSGWALTPGANYRYRTDEAIALSDHADHPGLLECVRRVQPKRVLTVHGYAREFAAELRQRGIEAWSAMGNDQLELQVCGRPQEPGSPARDRHRRPSCPFADFTDLCRLVGETQRRTRKIELLADYLRRPGVPLATATTWLTGRALPRRDGQLQTGTATLRRALLSLPGAREIRYREISTTQNDAARTARLLLEELPLQPSPVDLPEILGFFRELAGSGSSIGRIEALGGRLRTLHPAEGETLVKLLTGDLRIGLKEGLVEDALTVAFDADPKALRRAHMLTGDLGETAELARDGLLDRAALHPFVPVKVMLASPGESAATIFTRHSTDAPRSPLPAPRSLWLEPKYDGIRSQLHKSGDRVGLYSRDLKPIDRQFPELLEAARAIPGDFILDGEIIAHAEGRRLTFFDLQKRLGRLNTAQTDLFSESDLPPVHFIAFDILLHNGSTLLDHPLTQRRRHLEALLNPSTPEAPTLPDTSSTSGAPTGRRSTAQGATLGPPSELDSGALKGRRERRITPIPLIHADSIHTLETAFKQALADGHEGLISKQPDSPYLPGRRGMAWLKLKGVMPTLDCVVVAAEQGHGKRAELLSDYTFAVRDEDSDTLRIIGKAYSGLTDLEIEELTDHFQKHTLEKKRRKHLVEPNLVLEIAFDSIQPSKRHDSGLALRFPRIKAIRRDKTLADIDTLRSAKALLG
ncbi:ATP-dependent DNA ligase [Haloferula sp. A504]|uniref:ATP-dependent DNA ligase n=1 Tax=Haloferula sp. A504 TaxID=3373601 RepID=UPI0031C376A9|nr:ATP-dependent DNA ligase [Verrucomicrobiaceae bacterium E54]